MMNNRGRHTSWAMYILTCNILFPEACLIGAPGHLVIPPLCLIKESYIIHTYIYIYNIYIWYKYITYLALQTMIVRNRWSTSVQGASRLQRITNFVLIIFWASDVTKLYYIYTHPLAASYINWLIHIHWLLHINFFEVCLDRFFRWLTDTDTNFFSSKANGDEFWC